MLELFGNAWELSKGHILCITTNGAIRRDGEAVMGRGIAYQALQKFPRLPMQLGKAIQANGNHLADLGQWDQWYLLSFPVKAHWSDRARFKLIAQSARELQDWFWKQASNRNRQVYLPRPGCGNGGLEWPDVKEVLEYNLAPILLERLTVVARKEEQPK